MLSKMIAVRGLGCLVLLVGLGCSSSKNADFVPASANARKALDAALKTWQDGHPHGVVPNSSKPKIEILDARWRAGEKLTSYEIIKEEPATDGAPRFFTVRLTTNKGAPREVRYVVVGIDPLWVYLEDDFKKLSGTGM